MSMVSILYLSFRNYLRYLNRYSIILISLIVVNTAFILMLGITSGITNTVLDKSSRYLSGDVVVQALDLWEGANRVEITNPSVLEEFIEDRAARIQAVSKRSLYWREHRLLFNGKYIRPRRIIGVDWESEKTIIEELFLHSGSIPREDDRDGILISTLMASNLGANTGDRVLLNGVTESGQYNTKQFIVRGIFNEGSFFGYVVYVHKEALNEFAALSIHYINEIGIHLKNQNTRQSRARLAQEIWDELNGKYELLPVLESRDDAEQYSDPTDKIGYYVFAIRTIDAQVADIIELLNALSIIVYAVLLVFSLLITIGVSNTFSLIVIERTKEIGTLRALGTRQWWVMKLFLSESVFLGVSGVAPSIVCGLLILIIMSNSIAGISNSSFMTLFLRDGKMPWNISLGSIAIVFIISLLSCIIGCMWAVYKTSRLTPVEALRHEY